MLGTAVTLDPPSPLLDSRKLLDAGHRSDSVLFATESRQYCRLRRQSQPAWLSGGTPRNPIES